MLLCSGYNHIFPAHHARACRRGLTTCLVDEFVQCRLEVAASRHVVIRPTRWRERVMSRLPDEYTLSSADGILMYDGAQIDATLDSYVNPDKYEEIPMDPKDMPKKGKEVFLVSKHEGRIARVPGVDIIRGLPSFR